MRTLLIVMVGLVVAGVASSSPAPDWVAAGYGDSLTGPLDNKWCGHVDPPRSCDYTLAVAGEMTLPGSNRLLADLAAGDVIMPDTHYVTLSWGANDVRAGGWDVNTNFINPLRDAATAVRAQGMEPILNVTHPQYETADSGHPPCTPLWINYRIRDVMKPAIEALALEFDPPLQVVDLWTAYMAVPEPDRCALYADHVHQTPEGYEFMADQFELIMDGAYSPSPIDYLPTLSPWSQLALAVGLLVTGLGVWRGRAH